MKRIVQILLIMTLGLLLALWGCQMQPGMMTFLNGANPASNGEVTSKKSATSDGANNQGGTIKTVQVPLGGSVSDQKTGQPIEGATIFHDGESLSSNADGSFALNKVDPNLPILVKAAGYKQLSVSLSENPKLKISMRPFDAKGLYLTHFGVSSKVLRNKVLGLINETELNSVVIDVKGDRGLLSYKYDVPLAAQIGAHKLPTIKNIKSFIEDLHQKNIYVIGRIVVFKDNLLANAKPEWAIIDTRTKKPWADNEHLAWVDPFRKEVWEYNIAIAKEAAKAGFDEIQFDYMRFPTDGRLTVAKYSQPNNMENRVKTINSFLEKASRELLPYNVYFSGDVFGYVPWNQNDTDIGQRIEDVAKYLDYICLMVYPSGYHLGIPGYRNPVEHPREIVYNTLEKAKHRLGGRSKKLRPWLQNFRDYAFDRRPYTGVEIRLQIQACEQANSGGYLLWDPRNKYDHTREAFKDLKPSTTEVAKKLPPHQPVTQ